MKAVIRIERGSYGFGYNWSLVVTKRNGEQKSFYLGQDVKFCSRVLGMSPAYVVEQIGSGDITKPKVNARLANFIIDTLNLDELELFSMHGWELSAQ